MTSSTLADRAGHSTASTGTGALTLGTALGAVAPNLCTWQSAATAGISNGQQVSYVVLDSNGNWEYGHGTYASAGPKLTRTTVLGSSNSGSAINVSGQNTQVFLTLLSEDIAAIIAAIPATANPGATIGLTAVNGSAASVMRSDAAPALSQAITPTWSGTHTFADAGQWSTSGLVGPIKLVVGGNNTYNTASPTAADIVMGDGVNGTRHDSSIMFWNTASADRIFAHYDGTYDNFYLSTWNVDAITGANVKLGVTSGAPSSFGGNLLVAGGSPWFDVKAFGAKGNGSTNDATAISNAIAAAEANPYGGIVFFPPGTFLVSTGISITSGSVTLLGCGPGSSTLTAGTNNITTLTLGSGVGTAVISNMSVFGGGVSGSAGPANWPTLPAVVMNNVNACYIDRAYLSGGNITLEVTGGGGNYLTNIFVNQPYTTALYYTTGASFHARCFFDNTSTVPTNNRGAWAAGTHYAVGDAARVTVPSGPYSGVGFWLYCTTAGFSGSSQPALLSYGNTISEAAFGGTAAWLLCAPASNWAIQIDTGAGENYFNQCDTTGWYATNGGALLVTDANNNACTVFHQGPLGGAASIQGGGTTSILECQGGGNISYAGGQQLQIMGCNPGLGSGGAATISINAGQSRFSIVGNLFGAGTTITVNAGASDHYVISNNVGVTVTDNGTGTNKSVTGNVA